MVSQCHNSPFMMKISFSSYIIFKFDSLDKSDETISTWTESYEPYEYEPEYDQSSLTTDQITETTATIGTTVTNQASIATTSDTIRSEAITFPTETTISASTSSSEKLTTRSSAVSSTSIKPTTIGQMSFEPTKQDISFKTKTSPRNDFELDCDDESNDVITTESPSKSEFLSQSINSGNSVGSVKFSHQKSISSSSSGKTHLKYSMTGGGSDNSRTTRIVIQGQGDSGIQNVINCFGTYRNTSCIRQLCKVHIIFENFGKLI